MKTDDYQTIIIGAGAAGLYLAYELGLAGISALLLDHSDKIGKKILISGGGRCNFTNLKVTAKNYHSSNPHFMKSALARFSPWDIIDLFVKHNIPYYEKEHGQLFCENSSKDILQALISEVLTLQQKVETRIKIKDITYQNSLFHITCQGKKFKAQNLVIATGGLSYPQLGATDLGHHIAKQFGHKIIPPSPALVGLRSSSIPHSFFSKLAGISMPVTIKIPHKIIEGDLLFTHHGISGPAVLTTSLYAQKNQSIIINFLPKHNVQEELMYQRDKVPQDKLINHLELSKKFKQLLLQECSIPYESRLGELSNRHITQLADIINRFSFTITGTDGWKKAEVTRGGVSTEQISSKTLESKLQPGLYFAGEVMDVTGELGGFNLHWAWASSHAIKEHLISL